jgi:hypothetical protein
MDTFGRTNRHSVWLVSEEKIERNIFEKNLKIRRRRKKKKIGAICGKGVNPEPVPDYWPITGNKLRGPWLLKFNNRLRNQYPG